MVIEVLGTGCPRCKEVEKRTFQALAELNVPADVRKVADIREIAARRILGTPGLIIDGKIKSQGRLPSVAEIKGWIEEERT